MNRFRPLRLATLLCIVQFGRAFAAERHVPAQYPTIQQAVNAAVSGDIVRIAPGNYTEQVVVAFKSRLTLAGEPGAILHAFPNMSPTLENYGWSHYPVCGIYRSDVVISGLHFEGESLGAAFPGTLDGVLFLGSGGVVTNCTFSGFRPTDLSSGRSPRAIYCYNWVNVGAGQVSITIAANTFANNHTSLRIAGDPNSADPGQLRMTMKIHGNRFTGFGPAPSSNTGILINCGVTGDVSENFFSDFAGTGVLIAPAIAALDSSNQPHGRFVPLQPLAFHGNNFTNNGQHLFLIGGDNSRIEKNTFLSAAPGVDSWGGLQVSGTNVVIANNNFAEMPIGTLLLGTESWPAPSPAFPPAVNPTMFANWFCNVPSPIKVNPLVTVLHEQDTETNCPVTLEFQSIAKSLNGEMVASLRGWHGDSYVIESSTNLQNWIPTRTNHMALPLFEFRDTNAAATPRRFYRALKQD